MNIFYKRSAQSSDLHDQWVEAIARDRYGAYLSRYVVGTNPGPAKRFWVARGPERLYPDIVVFDPSNSDLATGERYGQRIAFAEVETAESVNEAELDQWREYASVGPFDLYVPMGTGGEAVRLLAGMAGVKVYEYSVLFDQNQYKLALAPSFGLSIPRFN